MISTVFNRMIGQRRVSALAVVLFVSSPLTVATAADMVLPKVMPMRMSHLSLGFYQTNAPWLPVRVREASESVFKIITLQNFIERPTSIARAGVEKMKTLKIDEPYEGREPATLPEMVQIYEPYVQACEARKQANCVLPSLEKFPDKGAGFLLGGKGRVLWTATHVLEGALRIALAETGPESDLFQIARTKAVLKTVFVFNREGQLVAHPLRDPATIEEVASPIVQTNDKPTGVIPHHDLIAIRFKSSLGRDLRAAQPYSSNNQYYAIGFPGCTGCSNNIQLDEKTYQRLTFTRAPYPNATGREQMVTVGVVTQLRRTLTGDVFDLSNDATGGMSGGVVVNDNGEAIGSIRQSRSPTILEPSA